LEGTVVSSNVAFEDLPLSHYTHDFNFRVLPDDTADNRFTNLLGIQENPITRERLPPDEQQSTIQVEWETGLAADNDGNPFQSVNQRGDSGGFFSAGHHRWDTIWNWPTNGDHVRVEGLWIWDRYYFGPTRPTGRVAPGPGVPRGEIPGQPEPQVESD
jgi:hypothetical protein